MSLLSVQNIKKHYPVKSFMKPTQWVKALDGVSFALETGKTLAIVGESGCGKSTLAKSLMRIEPPTSGSILMDGIDALTLPSQEYRKKIQMVFQDPYSSINPRKKALEIISEPLVINSKFSKAEIQEKTMEAMARVGLRPEFSQRYPHMFSGGQRQRIGIARALILQPKILICDEPVSALDVSIQSQVLNLLMDIQDQFNFSYLFISHDLSVVRHISDSVLVMYLGKTVEYGSKSDVFGSPKHPYTRALLESAPHFGKSGKKPSTIQGELPSPLNPPTGCAFHKRCPIAKPLCGEEAPALRSIQNQQVACHFAEAVL